MMTTHLSNHFLIAMPNLADPNFFHTVTYICEHNEHGALGIVINRPMAFPLGDIFSQMNLTTPDGKVAETPVYMGGPVQPERGFVLHQPLGSWESTLRVAEHIALTTSLDILNAISANRGPDLALVAIGYAGWGAGQLEQELTHNAWLSGPANEEILFHTPPAQRWEAAAALLGVDLNLLSVQSGHA